MTKRLYLKNSYQNIFKAKVEKIDSNNVWLDKTCFYPESGGQAGDTGLINNQRVINTQFDQDKNIFHILESKPDFKVGDTVNGQIDWERRHRIMRVHAASHIMEHFLFKIFGIIKRTGSHLNEKHDKSTYKYNKTLDPVKLTEIERLTNEFISRNLPIRTWPDRKKPHFRYWKCREIQMPCGGTHPRNTSEIGPIKIKRETGGKGRETIITSLFNPYI